MNFPVLTVIREQECAIRMRNLAKLAVRTISEVNLAAIRLYNLADFSVGLVESSDRTVHLGEDFIGAFGLPGYTAILLSDFHLGFDFVTALRMAAIGNLPHFSVLS